MPGKNWTDSEISLLRQCYDGNPSALVTKFPGRSLKAIRNQADRCGLTKRLRKYFQQDDYFACPNMYNCYWAGFLAADGCIASANRITMSLATIDGEHLHKLKRAVGFTGPIHWCSNNGTGQYYLQINSKQMVIDLEQHFNLTERKSLTLQPPRIVDEAYTRSFIRGYVDGDGCWSSQFSILGTMEMLVWIRNIFHMHVGTRVDQTIAARDNYFKIEYGSFGDMDHLATWLYTDSENEFRLSRKYNKCKEMRKLALN